MNAPTPTDGPRPPGPHDAVDRECMTRALAAAATVRCATSPNPWVGAVVRTPDGRMFHGATEAPGGAHAEVVALRQAGDQARGATLYVTLEPCAHTGRTGPCTRAIIDAGIEVDRLERYIGDLDADRKEAKEDLKKAVATLRACVIRRKTGQKELFTPQDLAQTTAPVVAAVVDEGAGADIRMLLGKEIKKIVGPEEFQAAKDRGEPIGMTEKQVEVLEDQGWTTIGTLEKAMRENAWWHKELKGFGPDKIDRLTITLAAFRRAHPMPSETTVTVTVGDASVTTTPEGLRDLAETVPTPDAGAEAAETIAVPEWQQSADRIRALLQSANALLNHGPGDCIEFMESVTTQATDMLAWITEHEHVTEEQSVAITNWAEGIAKWYPQN